MARLHRARKERFELQRLKPLWRKRLRDASDQGNASPVAGATYGAGTPAAQAIDRLEEKRESASLITSAELEAAVAGLESALAQVDRRANAALQADYSSLLSIVDYAEDFSNIEFSNAIGDIERTFGEAVRPTRMGNVAEALDRYGSSRYSMNLAVFWSRMQVVIQDRKEIYGSLLDAKCQLDFLVMCCWLCLVTSAGWLVGVQWLPFSAELYFVLLVVFPLAARVFYELAVENYLVLADLVRSIVDLYRFQLLRSLHVAPPRGIREERAVWSALGQLASGSSGVEISYQHDGP